MMFMFFGGFIVPILIISVFYYLLYLMIRRNSAFSYTRDEKKLLNKLKLTKKRLKVTMSMPNVTCEIESSHLDYGKFDVDHYSTFNENSNIYDSRDIMEKYKFIQTIVRAEVKIVKYTSVILLIFFLSWFPYACIALIGQFGTNIHRVLTPITAFLPFLFAKTSCALNPLFFILTNSRCRNFYFNVFKHFYKPDEKTRTIVVKEIVIRKKCQNISY